LLPVLLLALLPLMTDPTRTSDPSVRMLVETVATDPSLAGATLTERLARLLLRDAWLFYLFMPVVLGGNSAALGLVREKEQRTLEPILATPIRDRELVAAKVLAAGGPAMLVTALAAAAGTVSGMVAGWWRTGAVIWPTMGNLVALGVLAPLLTAVACLAGLRASARFPDAPSAAQYTGLVVVPLGLVAVAVVGRPAMASPLVGLLAVVPLAGVIAWLFRRNLRRLRREELLSRWR
jgi:ABC-type Na+ efflux pump permease subunit